MKDRDRPPWREALTWAWDRDERRADRSRDRVRARWHEVHLIRARRDDVSAQFMVGFHYEKGYGVARDYAEAYKWYAIANSQGYAPAALAKDRIGRKLDPEELSRAEALIRAWKAGYGSRLRG